MGNPVILSGVDAASEAGFSTLRFNFRGVPRPSPKGILQNHLKGVKDSSLPASLGSD